MASQELEILIKAKGQFDQAFGGLLAAMKETQAEGKKIKASLEDSLGSFASKTSAAGVALLPLTAAITGTGFAAIKMAGDFEQTKIAFTTMLGSGEAATKFLKDLESFAAKTPFEFPDLVRASQRLMAMGFSADQIVPSMTAIGDAVSGLGGGAAEIDRAVTALGQMQSRTKVLTGEMNQLVELGIPAWDLLAKKIGVDVPKAMDMASKGMISSAVGVPAILEGMTKKFGGMMEQQSKTLLGQFSTIKDELGFILRDLGAALLPIAQKAMDAFKVLIPVIRDVVQWFSKLPEPAQMAIVAFAALAAAVGPILLGIGGLAAAGAALLPILAPIAVGMTTIAMQAAVMAGSVAAAAAPFLPLAAAITAAAAAGYLIGDWMRGMIDEYFPNFSAGLDSTLQSVYDWAAGIDRAKLEQGTLVSTETVKFAKEFGEKQKALAASTKEVGAASKQSAEQVLAQAEAMKAAEKEAKKLQKEYAEAIKKYKELHTEMGRLQGQGSGASVIKAGLGDAAKASANDALEAIKELSQLGEPGRVAANQIKDAWEGASGAMLIGSRGAMALSVSMDDLAEDAERAAQSIPRVKSETERWLEAMNRPPDPPDVDEFIEPWADGLGNLRDEHGNLLKEVDGGWQVIADGAKKSVTLMDAFTFAASNATTVLRIMGLEGNKTLSGITSLTQAAISGDIMGGLQAGADLSQQGGLFGTYAKFFTGGGLLAGVGDLFGGGGEGKKVEEMREALFAAAGGFEEMERKAREAGVSLNDVLKADNVKEYEAALKGVNAALDMETQAQAELQAAVEKYGFTVEELGPKYKAQELDKMAQGLFKEWSLLTASGIEQGTVISKMGPAFNEYVQTVVSAGGKIPETMRPALEEMLRMGQLTDEAGNKMTSLDGVTWTKDLTEGMQALVDKMSEFIDHITDAAGGLGNVGSAIAGIPDSKTIRINLETYGNLPDLGAGEGISLGSLAGQVPGHSTGTISTSTHPAIVHGSMTNPEVISPLDKLIQNLGRGAAEAAANAGGGGETMLNITLNLEGDAIAKFITKATREKRAIVHPGSVRR